MVSSWFPRKTASNKVPSKEDTPNCCIYQREMKETTHFGCSPFMLIALQNFTTANDPSVAMFARDLFGGRTPFFKWGRIFGNRQGFQGARKSVVVFQPIKKRTRHFRRSSGWESNPQLAGWDAGLQNANLAHCRGRDCCVWFVTGTLSSWCP